MILVHKVSLGILEYMPWSGVKKTFNGQSISKHIKITKANIGELGLDMDEWWVVDEAKQSSLAYKLRLHYPFFDPVVIDGQLIDIVKWDKYRIYGETPPSKEDIDEEAIKRRKRINRRMTKLKLW